MAAATKLLISTLLLFFLKVNSQRCDASNVVIQVANTGKMFNKSDTIFEVEVKNTCACPMANVFLSSKGFTSSMNVDPKMFRREGIGYLVNDGKAIPRYKSVKFQYSWPRSFKMTTTDYRIVC